MISLDKFDVIENRKEVQFLKQCFFSLKTLFNPIRDEKNLDWSKLKEIADDILKCIEIEKKVSYRVENIVRKGEIACYKQFLLFSQCFLL